MSADQRANLELLRWWLHELLHGFLCLPKHHTVTLSGQHHAWTEWACVSVGHVLRGLGL